MPGEGEQLAQQCDSLRGQGNQMRTAIELAVDSALHFDRRDGPDATVDIQLVPLHGPHVAGALEEQCGQEQGGASDRLAGTVVDGPHQLADLCRLKDSGHVLDVQRLQSTVKIRRRIALAAAGGHPMAEHLAGGLAQGVRGFPGASLFKLAQRVEQLGCRDLG